MKSYDLPREMKDILKVYEKKRREELSRRELRDECLHLPTKVFEKALMEMIYLGVLEGEMRNGGIYYRLKRNN